MRSLCQMSLVQVLLLASGCGLLLDTELSPEGGDPDDASVVVDAEPVDAGPILDAMPMDGSAPCLRAVAAADLVAHYTFDGDGPSDIVDERGVHDGTTSSGVSHVAGRCGLGLAFGGAFAPGHAEIGHDDEFNLEEGSLELFARIPDVAPYGIVSRDWFGVEDPGHFGLFTSIEGHVLVRLQDVEAGRGGRGKDAVWLCSNEPLRVGVWEHIAVSWGGDEFVQLWVNGERATLTDEATVTWLTGGGGQRITCGRSVRDHGIDGNSRSWILGANSNLRRDSNPENFGVPFVGGAIDELRILRVRLNYSEL